MDQPDFDTAAFDDYRGARRHRFMESSDINAAFREIFAPLRNNIRRGLSIEGQVYALEMDACIPGELLATEWIPPEEHGIRQARELADPGVRSALFTRLLAEQRSEALFAYICERPEEPVLYVEIVSADARYAARHAVRPGQGWHLRELVEAPHQRLGPLAGVPPRTTH